ncbi:MAG: response regulator [Candidatus Omnitrophica bacterium]|nr:response regulator [Candidatus Omnitrophota bacterium]
MTDTKKILVVDDEEDVRLFLEDFLSERDLTVFGAGGGEDALQIMAKENPDIVLLDVMMPGIDGLEVLEKIRENYPKTQVIMITALNDESRINKAKKLGAINYILKPFSLGYLETELMSLINKKP